MTDTKQTAADIEITRKIEQLEKQIADQAQRISGLEAAASKGCACCESLRAEHKQIVDQLATRITKLEPIQPAAAPSPVSVEEAPVAAPESVQACAPVPVPAPQYIEPPIWPDPASAARIIISYVHFFGAIKGTQGDEFVEIKNVGGATQDVSGWRISAGRKQDFTLPEGTVLLSGGTLRIYTNLESGQPGAFSYGSPRGLWNDAGDRGRLYDASGQLVSEYGYGREETRSITGIKAIYGLEDLKIVFNPEHLEVQRKGNKIDFLSAIERALRSLLDDPAEEGRPNAANQVRDNYEGVRPGADADLIKRFIRKHLNENQLVLVHDEGLPEGVEVKDRWIFRLKAGMADQHFVIVDRSGAIATYQELT